LIIGAGEPKLGTQIIGGVMVDGSNERDAITDVSVSLNLTST
jgi:hypothetical protein